MKENNIMDVVDRMNEHIAAIDHLTNTADGSIGACLHMLEREMQKTRDSLNGFREVCVDEELKGFHYEAPIQKQSLKQKILAASPR